jgi:Family of unknown function (DUF6690)
MRSLPAAVVFAAAGASYLYSHGDLVKNISPATWVSEEGADAAAAAAGPAEVERLAAAPKEDVIAVPGPEVTDLGKIFRFDLSPQSIAQRWSRVSTGLSDAHLQGYRVPLVTGTADNDLAGSLTYYYDARPRMRRITFLGTTGNPQRLVGFLAKYYGFRQSQNGNPRVTVYQARAPIVGKLQVLPAEVLDKHQSATNYRVELVLER